MAHSGMTPAPGKARGNNISCVLLAALALGACGSDTGPPPPPEGDPTFAAIHSETLERSCALSSCHGGAAPAAKLDFHLVSADDIIKICYSLVARQSCLFSNRLLVVPFKPEVSFLVDKLRGRLELDGEPDANCAGSNQRMPFGLPQLADNQIKQIEDWIATGANCAGPRPIDAAVDAPVDADIQIAGDVASVAAAATSIPAGQRTQVTVTLTSPAPRDGQTVLVTAGDDTVLGVPSAVRIEHDLSSVTFDVLGKRPGPATTVTAATGTNQKATSIAVTGLALSEILYQPSANEPTSEWIKIVNTTGVAIDLAAYSFGSGRANYTTTRAQLTGQLPAHSCVVIGGPTSDTSNGNPSYGQSLDFSPDLLNGSATNGQATGYALFNGTVAQVTATSIPLDAVLCGQNNGAGLLGADGLAAIPRCPDVAAVGHSVARTSVTTWVDQATPTPGNCTPNSL